MYPSVIGSLAAACYLLTGSLLAIRLSRIGSSGVSWNKLGLIGLGMVAVILHAMALIDAIWLPQAPDADSGVAMNLSFLNVLSLTGWLIAALLLVLACVRPIENLGIVLLPFSALTALLALLFPARRIVVESAQWPLELHIVLSISAYALLTLAAVQAALLALQDERLRRRSLGGFLRAIPPVTMMEALLFQLIAFGFVLLSLALLSGFLFLQDIFAQHLVHKTTLSIISWLVFGTLLWGRWQFGWRARTAVRYTLGGFVVLVLAYFGSELVLQIILQRR